MSLIFVFVDGIGLGERNGQNPFVLNDYPSFLKMTNGQSFDKQAVPVRKKDHFFTPADACLGVEGLPQSGTGQITLFTGINSARRLGKHFGPIPHSKIRDLLDEASIFKKFTHLKARCYFMNAFPKQYFDYAKQKNRWSTSTLMTKKAGLKLNSVAEVMDEKAITAEITQDVWRSRFSPDVPEIEESEAAERVVRMAGHNELVLVEHYLTDKAGHERDVNQAGNILRRFDQFLGQLMESVFLNGHTLLLTSDHGNLEDLSTRSHTRNDVPLFVMGKGAEIFHPAKSIKDVTPLCLKWYRSTLGQS